jgi:hypothetical protein
MFAHDFGRYGKEENTIFVKLLEPNVMDYLK